MDSGLFVCVQCGHVDMHDLARGEVDRARIVHQYCEVNVDQAPQPAPTFRPNTCTHCLTGAWHGQFPYRPFNPTTDVVSNPAPSAC